MFTFTYNLVQIIQIKTSKKQFIKKNANRTYFLVKIKNKSAQRFVKSGGFDLLQKKRVVHLWF